MGKLVPDEDEPLELPGHLDGDDGSAGTADAEESALADLLADIEDSPEDFELDTPESSVTSDNFGNVLFDEEEDEDEGGALRTREDSPIDLDDEDDEDDADEQGWTEGSEGATEPYEDDELDLEDESEGSDDGGLEGLEESLLEGLSERLGEEDSAPSRIGQGDDEGDGVLDDFGGELVREISPQP